MNPRELVQGVYGITDASLMPGRCLLEKSEQALRAGLRILQYRDKSGDFQRKVEEAHALMDLCRSYGALLVINDDPRLALQVGARAIHVGAQDPDVAAIRRELGPEFLLGVSCYADMSRALEASLAGADYLAFGSVFPSRTKPSAARASLEILHEARSRLDLPVVAIGGIQQDNAKMVVDAGADAIAVISALFGCADVASAYHGLYNCFLDPADPAVPENP